MIAQPIKVKLMAIKSGKTCMVRDFIWAHINSLSQTISFYAALSFFLRLFFKLFFYISGLELLQRTKNSYKTRNSMHKSFEIYFQALHLFYEHWLQLHCKKKVPCMKIVRIAKKLTKKRNENWLLMKHSWWRAFDN